MKTWKILLVTFSMVLLGAALMSSWSTDFLYHQKSLLCYQEDHNSTNCLNSTAGSVTESDADCDDLGDSTFMYDGNWSTGAGSANSHQCIHTLEYPKPTGYSDESTIFTYYTVGDGLTNVSIGSECLDRTDNVLKIRVIQSRASLLIQCFNESDDSILIKNGDGDLTANYFNESAVYWNVTLYNETLDKTVGVYQRFLRVPEGINIMNFSIGINGTAYNQSNMNFSEYSDSFAMNDLEYSGGYSCVNDNYIISYKTGPSPDIELYNRTSEELIDGFWLQDEIEESGLGGIECNNSDVWIMETFGGDNLSRWDIETETVIDSFILHPSNANPAGISIGNNRINIYDSTDDIVYVYNLTDNSSLASYSGIANGGDQCYYDFGILMANTSEHLILYNESFDEQVVFDMNTEDPDLDYYYINGVACGNISGHYKAYLFGGLYDEITMYTYNLFPYIDITGPLQLEFPYASYTNGYTDTTTLAPYMKSYVDSCTIEEGFCWIPLNFTFDMNGNFTYFSISASNDGIIENSQIFNATTYETARESFILNISVDNSAWNSVTAQLYYDGTAYDGTKASGTDESIFTYTMDIADLGGSIWADKDFNWEVSLTNDSGTYKHNATTNTQRVHYINFSICNATGPQSYPYINFSFKDESDESVMNATNDLTDVTYWLGGGSVSKTYTYSNTSSIPNYEFCFYPQNRSVIVDLSFKYSNTSYPLRTFAYDDQTLTNSTTNQVLYLLGTADGIYSTIQVIEASGAVISGVTVQVERQFSGVWTLVEQGTTGDDGAVTFWVNPNFNHRITASKTNYVTSQQTITPSQSLYTMTLQKSAGDADYTSDIEGLRWTFYPASGDLDPGAYNFNATVTSSLENLENCKLELINNTGGVIDSDTSITNTTYCFVNIDYTVPADSIFFARLYVDTTNTTGFVIVDADWKFVGLERAIKDWRTLKSFFTDVQDLGEFGEGEQAEFSRLVLFFILTTMFIGMFMYFTGVELQNPGLSLILIWVIAIIASVAGFLTIELGSPQATAPLEQYGLATILTLIIVNYALVIMRRAND